MGKSLEVPTEVRPRSRWKSNPGNSIEPPAPWVFAATIKQLLRQIRVINGLWRPLRMFLKSKLIDFKPLNWVRLVIREKFCLARDQ
jgi:hypothetical protein